MLAQLSSMQLVEMEAYEVIEANPVSEVERKAAELQRIKDRFLNFVQAGKA